MTKAELRKALGISAREVRALRPLKKKSILDAIALPTGPSREKIILHVLWSGKGYQVGVGKPGKETTRTDSNSDDMWPFIRKDEKIATDSATFLTISKEIRHMKNVSPKALELLGCLLYRSAWMLDHELKEDKVMYSPNADVIALIEKDIPTIYGVPFRVFLQYLEMIALNEDVKYYSKGIRRGKPFGSGAGRRNNLTSCAHLIAVLLDRQDFLDFAYGFSQMRGVSPMPITLARRFFPFLEDDDDSVKEMEAQE